ncbi:hypothetical protein NLM24_26515, partial [Nocardia zapadnayensis]
MGTGASVTVVVSSPVNASADTLTTAVTSAATAAAVLARARDRVAGGTSFGVPRVNGLSGS